MFLYKWCMSTTKVVPAPSNLDWYYTIHPLHESIGYDPIRTDAANYKFSSDFHLNTDGSVLVVGAPGYNSFFNLMSGAVFVYTGFDDINYQYTSIDKIEFNNTKITDVDALNYDWSSVSVIDTIVYGTVMDGNVYQIVDYANEVNNLGCGIKKWSASCSYNYDLYLAEINGDIYKYGNPNLFPIPVNHTMMKLEGMVSINNQLLVGTNDGRVGQLFSLDSSNVLTQFQSLNRNWSAIATIIGDMGFYVYVSEQNGLIYRLNLNTGEKTAINEISRNWSGLASGGSDRIYACVYGGDIYEQINQKGEFVAFGGPNRNWTGICQTGLFLYACVENGDIYQINRNTKQQIPLNQTNRNWSGISEYQGDIYACVYGGDIYKKSYVSNDFVPLNQTNRNWTGLVPLTLGIYGCVDGGDIYVQLGYTGDFVSLDKTKRYGDTESVARNWSGITGFGYDVIACCTNGDIYMQSNSDDSFIPFTYGRTQFKRMHLYENDIYVNTGTSLRKLDSPSYILCSDFGMYGRYVDTEVFANSLYIADNVRGILKLQNCARPITAVNIGPNVCVSGAVVVGSDVYVCAYGGDIYKQTGGTGDFVPLNQISRNWNGMTTLGGDIYACVFSGDIYKQTNGTGDFIALNQTYRTWTGMTTLGSDVYGCSTRIYKQTNGVGNFVEVPNTSQSWNSICTIGTSIYACMTNAVFKGNGTTFTVLAYAPAPDPFYGMAAYNGKLYITTLYSSGSTSNYESIAGRHGIIEMDPITGDATPTIIADNKYQLISGVPNGIYVGVLYGGYYQRSTYFWDCDNRIVYGDGYYLYNHYNWSCLSVINNALYAYTDIGDVYVKSQNSDDFTLLGSLNLNISGVKVAGDSIFYLTTDGGIYVTYNAFDNFSPTKPPKKLECFNRSKLIPGWNNLELNNNTLFVASSNGRLHGIENVNKELVALNQTPRYWTALCQHKDHIYACVRNGAIYKQTNGVGDFVQISELTAYWKSISSNGNSVCAVTESGPTPEDYFFGDIYQQLNGEGDFVSIDKNTRYWSTITSYGTDFYLTCEQSQPGDGIHNPLAITNNVFKLTSDNALTIIGNDQKPWSGSCNHNNFLYFSEPNREIHKVDLTVGNNTLAGTAVATNGICDTVAVGVPGQDYLNASDVGYVYIFTNINDQWCNVQTIYRVLELGDIVSSNQSTFEGMTVLGSDIYACTWGGIYKQTNGIGDFELLPDTNKRWISMTTIGTTLYAAVEYEDIYIKTEQMTQFEPLNQRYNRWHGLASLVTADKNDVYSCVYGNQSLTFGGDIYKQTNGVGDFIALNQPHRAWSNIATLNSNVYACAYGDDIYVQYDGEGDFLPLNQTYRNWLSLCSSNGHMYAIDYDNILYRQVYGVGDFIPLIVGDRDNIYPYCGMADYFDQLYFSEADGNIVKISHNYDQYTNLKFGSGLAMSNDRNTLVVGSHKSVTGGLFLYEYDVNKYVYNRDLLDGVINHASNAGIKSQQLAFNSDSTKLFVSTLTSLATPLSGPTCDMTIVSNILHGSAGMTISTDPTSGTNDDGYWTITIPWGFEYFETLYTDVYIGSNGYVTFTDGSTDYQNFSASSPALPKIMISSGDNSCQAVYTLEEGVAPNRTYIVRFEGTNGTSGTLGDPNMVWELTFYESILNKVTLQVGQNANELDSDFFGVYTDTTLIRTLPIRSNVGYDLQTYIAIATENPTATGVSCVFEKIGNTWLLQTTLVPEVSENDLYGWCLDCDNTGNTVLIGAPGSNKVYVYEYDTSWVLSTELTKQLDPTLFSFGTSVSITGAGDKAYVFVSNTSANNYCYIIEYNKIDSQWIEGKTYQATNHTGGVSNHTVDGVWENIVLTDKQNNRLLMGHPSDSMNGHSGVGFIYGYK